MLPLSTFCLNNKTLNRNWNYQFDTNGQRKTPHSLIHLNLWSVYVCTDVRKDILSCGRLFSRFKFPFSFSLGYPTDDKRPLILSWKET